ncbi:mediator of RNA polymerase II transcription subunit 15a-like [Chenopodium quinoa]|uniref:Mediator complex subunit 15 KIX domain-containing protein n=1 Tax=Chenopodium quinoa TaxID=63459 RepID=A0A803MMR1_CHEQI|nr:mediator of RNA polymerase II transcription subunit 15a-like [Chenopodium quinoa]
MDPNNLPPAQNGAPPLMNGHDWRSQLLPESRQRIVNKILETLKRHLPYSGQEGLQELKQIAVRFEEKIYNAATSQSDYLRKISLKMLTMEARSHNSVPNASPSNSSSRNPLEDLSIDEAEQPPQSQQPQHTTPINEEN